MSKLIIDKSTLIDIADAVREIEGTLEAIPVEELAQRIREIPAKLISSTY